MATALWKQTSYATVLITSVKTRGGLEITYLGVGTSRDKIRSKTVTRTPTSSIPMINKMTPGKIGKMRPNTPKTIRTIPIVLRNQ